MITKTDNIFHLCGKDVSLVIALSKGGAPVQAYFGKKIRSCENLFEDLRFSPHANSTVIPLADGSEETLDREMHQYNSFGYNDLHDPMYTVENEDGNSISHLVFKDFKITEGASQIKGMPCVFGNDAQTLELLLSDDVIGLEVTLSYVVFDEYNIIARSTLFKNKSGKKLKLTRAFSSSFSLDAAPYDAIYFSGGWASERNFVRVPIEKGCRLDLSENSGLSGHNQNPFVMIAEKDATEKCGNVYSMSLIYSGNHSTEIQRDRFGKIRVMQGMNPLSFSWDLNGGEEFYTPQSIMAFSSYGIGGISRTLTSLFRENLCRSAFVKKGRPILINNWEATYFDFTEQKLLEIAKAAQKVGAELFVLDDGWFGKRNSEKSSLGDWFVNREKLPGGLSSLADKINAMGLKFGIWLEPEMVSPDSNLYRKHPDWAIHTTGRTPALGRSQYILDLSRDEVCEYIIKSVCDILDSADISYVKWDMNRYLTDMPCGGYNHKYVLGLYKIFDAVTKRFPNVLFEGCASGGGRFDYGILSYMPQIWTSDNSDAVSRMYIQHSTSMGYPQSSISAHVTASPNHQNGHITSLKTRGDIALCGVFGYELDITKESEEALNEIKEQIIFAKKIRHIITNGTFYRLSSPYDGNFCTWQTVSEKKDEIFVMSCKMHPTILETAPNVKLANLDAEAMYQDTESGKIYGGDYLMYRGISVKYPTGDYATQTFLFKRV